MAGATVSDDLRSVAWACERPTKCAKGARTGGEAPTSPSTEAFLALVSESDDLTNCSRAFTLEKQCTTGLIAEAKEL